MPAPDDIDIDHLQNWVGKTETGRDIITPELLRRFHALLDGLVEPASPMPLGLHWCLAQPAQPAANLGPDGHPAKGGFLPPVPLPRRMWASSTLEFQNPLIPEIPVERRSVIADVTLKQSPASGALVFVTVDHQFLQQEQCCIRDRQMIVYRQAAPYRKPAPAENVSAIPGHSITPDKTLLFRYSAVTFNGHRIHYDLDYATKAEGYPGLVVHGPLMATLLMNFAQAKRADEKLSSFSFRGAAPAFADQPLALNCADPSAEALEIRDRDGAIIMTAKAAFSENRKE